MQCSCYVLRRLGSSEYFSALTYLLAPTNRFGRYRTYLWDVERREREEDNLEATDKIRALEKKMSELQEKVLMEGDGELRLRSSVGSGCANSPRCSDT